MREREEVATPNEYILHTLKIEDAHYSNICMGRKKFEVRYNDRNYQVNDLIYFTDTTGRHNREGQWKIIFVQSGYGLKEEFVVLGIERLNPS